MPNQNVKWNQESISSWHTVCIGRKRRKKNSLPISQRDPSYPSVQLQLNEFTWSMQEPPFWQGEEEHSSMSDGSKRRLEREIFWQ